MSLEKKYLADIKQRELENYRRELLYRQQLEEQRKHEKELANMRMQEQMIIEHNEDERTDRLIDAITQPRVVIIR